MIRSDFRILLVDLTIRKAHIVDLPGRETYIGGSGLAAMLLLLVLALFLPMAPIVQHVGGK
jgi:hypothetical protein